MHIPYKDFIFGVLELVRDLRALLDNGLLIRCYPRGYGGGDKIWLGRLHNCLHASSSAAFLRILNPNGSNGFRV
jgi:hypothetical protein